MFGFIFIKKSVNLTSKKKVYYIICTFSSFYVKNKMIFKRISSCHDYIYAESV